MSLIFKKPICNNTGLKMRRIYFCVEISSCHERWFENNNYRHDQGPRVTLCAHLLVIQQRLLELLQGTLVTQDVGTGEGRMEREERWGTWEAWSLNITFH